MTTNPAVDLTAKLAEFDALIDQPAKNENPIQALLEANALFMPTPDLLHHDLHLNTLYRDLPG